MICIVFLDIGTQPPHTEVLVGFISCKIVLFISFFIMKYILFELGFGGKLDFTQQVKDTF